MKTHIVLVHGACHQAWHLHLLAQTLDAAGYTTSTPQLPSAALDPTGPSCTLAGDTAVITAALEAAAATSDAILPVFHSYAGVPGSEAVAALSNSAKAKIPRLVYLAAFVLEPGTNVLAADGGDGSESSSWIGRQGDCTLPVPDPIATFYHDVEPALAAQAVKHLVKQAYEPMAAKATQAGWKLFPVTYVFCAEDRAVPAECMRARVETILGDERLRGRWEVLTLEGGHSPFLSRPDECARVIRRAAGEDVGVDGWR
ncbi:hypothetical protein LTR36_010970 [Oleoguttula mirabilis]|uniref:AB hydrolase-1 domain-containing protein n=1 Tax=Oleoguttula mirabilis TaxID=1507867 RepID=A0AAV9J447_9PEZI|nr:hypothetical protein LTR36_010970 [Oleoguttula mirabilis]